MILKKFAPSFNVTTNDMLSDISFGIVVLLEDALIPKDNLPSTPGKTDVYSLKARCEGNLTL